MAESTRPVGAWMDELWGGLAAMLVALPSAIAFGVAMFAAVGEGHAAQGAMAGMLGAAALGLVASTWGGAPRLITAPCAPAVAVLSAQAIELGARGTAPAAIVLLLGATALLAGGLQVVFGVVGLGRLIKYMPYPVVSGYLSGVGLTIILSQVAKLLGAAGPVSWHAALRDPGLWDGRSLLIGGVTMAVMLQGHRLTQRVPATILALLAGAAVYGALAIADPGLRLLDGNSLVVGSLGVQGHDGLSELVRRWAAVGSLHASDLWLLVVPALTLAVLLSIDTLKTCVVLDAMTRSRHDSNRTLVAQGLGNMASAVVGGMAGAGTMGATLVNLGSGGRTRWSGVAEGVLALVAVLVLAPALAWVPLGALAGILIVVGLRMLDRDSLHFLTSRQTVLDFVVIATVVGVALTVGLIAASGAGILLAVVLFVREQLRGAVVAHRGLGSGRFSRRVRGSAEMDILAEEGAQCAILELQGSLFFGTTDQLYSALEPELAQRRYLILDLRRVQSIDVTAVHMLQQVEDQLAEQGGMLLFSGLPVRVPSGRDLRRYFQEVALARSGSRMMVFAELDDALEWVEDRLIGEAGLTQLIEMPLELREMDIFAGRKAETMAELEACMEIRTCPAGERIFARGDTGDEMYLIRLGLVRIVLPIDSQRSHHLATFGRGGFFGEMAFLDQKPRSADAVAYSDCELYVLSRSRFDALVGHHKQLGMKLMEGLARLLAARLRQADAELNSLESG